MARRFPLNPAHPERNCWGCDRYCAAASLACGNGSERTQHPVELFGLDWADWQDGRPGDEAAGTASNTAVDAADNAADQPAAPPSSTSVRASGWPAK